VMAMVTGCQWDGATLALKSQQPVMGHKMGGGIGLLTELDASNVPNCCRDQCMS
jgi:hypothetical protein